jgi:tetratricopeptide (TPR) repeat protein
LGYSLTAPPPVAIDSYAAGIKAKGLSELISNGESLLEKHQYDKAIATFNTAIDVAPNNPLILMARSNAELGGGYYAQANADIHLAVAQDSAVLMGQYDLQKHLGSDRLKSLISDLKEIAQSSREDTLHSFLLAYVYYNSHHIGQAADWIAIADNRANGQDSAIIQMKKYWNFNEDQQPAPSAPSTRPAMEK